MAVAQQVVSGETLSLWLAREMDGVRKELTRAQHRAARTIIKNDSLRVVLIGVPPGGEIGQHKAEGPITVHVLEGCIELHTARRSWIVGAGMLLSLGAATSHSVSSTEGGIFLLTIASDR